MILNARPRPNEIWNWRHGDARWSTRESVRLEAGARVRNIPIPTERRLAWPTTHANPVALGGVTSPGVPGWLGANGPALGSATGLVRTKRCEQLYYNIIGMDFVRTKRKELTSNEPSSLYFFFQAGVPALPRIG